jgi:oxygen-dependent protoporphyrinogen oxidase
MSPTRFFQGETVDDIAVGDLVEARLGRPVVDRLVEPLLGGVYAGHAADLSFAATMPELARETQVQGSLLRAAQLVGARRDRAAGPVFASIDGGLGRLPAAVAEAAGATFRLRTQARELELTDAGWAVTTSSRRGRERLAADGVVVATPAMVSASLLAGVAPQAAAELASVEYASVGLVSFLIPAQVERHQLIGTGFLVPPAEDRVIKAATFASRKWDYVSDQVPGYDVIRCSVGRYGETHHLERDDDDLAWEAWGELSSALDLDGAPIAVTVTRWDSALPQYRVGHVDRVARIHAALADLPGLAVCGAALEGVGVAACVASAQAGAQRTVATLVRRRGTMSP